jgi:hypothetical protein
MDSSSDRPTIVRLRHQLQTCQSAMRLAHVKIDVFRAQLMSAPEPMTMDTRTELLRQLAELRLLLAGAGEGGGRC